VGASLLIPDLEAPGVKDDGQATVDRGANALDRQLVPRDGRRARRARFSSPGSTPHARRAVGRQLSILELGLNEGPESLGFHDDLTGTCSALGLGQHVRASVPDMIVVVSFGVNRTTV
jgi:hypothetical protein